MGTPAATNVNTVVSDLPDYVQPYYKMLLNAGAALTYDPKFITDQLALQSANGTANGIPTTGGSPGGGPVNLDPGLGSIYGRPNRGYGVGDPNSVNQQSLSSLVYGANATPGLQSPSSTNRSSGTKGLMSLIGNQKISPLPGGTTTIGTGVGSTAPGAINYNPGQTAGPITLPGAVPWVPNGQGQVGYGPGSPSTTPGYGTGRTGPISNPGPTGGGAGGGGGTGGSGGGGGIGNKGVQTAPVYDNVGSVSSIANVIANDRPMSPSYGWSVKDPSMIPQIKQLYGQLTSTGASNNQIDSNAQLAALISKAIGMGVVNNAMIGPWAQNSYMFAGPAANTAAPAPVSGGGGGGGGQIGVPPPTARLAEGGEIIHFDTGGATTQQGSFPMAAYNPYPGQRVLDPTGMFGFDPSSSSPYGLSTPTQFAENQTYNLFSNNGQGVNTNPLQQAMNYTGDVYDRSYDAVKNASNQYGGILSNPLQTNYKATQFDPSVISVDPYQQYQTAAPMAVRPDLSAFNSQNNPMINQFPAVAYGVNPGAWVDQGVASAYMSPYTQQVNDAQQALVNRNFDEQLAQQHGQAAQAGAFGGTRQAVQDSLSNRDRQMQLDAVAAQNLNNAYNSGMGQYNQDRGAIMNAGQYGLQADLANQQAAMGAQYANQNAALTGRNQAAGYDIQAQLANQAAGLQGGQFNANLASQTQNQQVQAMLQAALANQNADLSAQGLTNQSNLTADQQHMAAWLNNQNALNANQQTQQGLLGLMSNQSGNLSNVQNLQQQMQLQQLGAIQGIGQTEDQRRQSILDLGYQNFTNQQNWPYQLANFQSGLLRGVPTAVNQEAIQYQNVNPAAQWTGLGLAGLGASGVGGG